MGLAQFANVRSIRNALDRARLRQANRLFTHRGLPLAKADLVTIEGEDRRRATGSESYGVRPCLLLKHPTLDKLQRLKFTGLVHALSGQMKMPDIAQLDFEERLGLLNDRELTERENRRLSNRLRRARLKHNAALEDIDYRQPRGLDKFLMRALGTCRWVAEHLNILITGPTGVGKTWLACALAQKACREGYSALYLRLPRLLPEMAIAKGDGRYPKLPLTLAKTEVLILDDWALAQLTAEHRRDLLEILEERHVSGSTLATSQLPIDQWHDTIGDPTLADAILDRLIHNAYRIELRGESMRKQAPKHPNDAPSSDPSSVTA